MILAKETHNIKYLDASGFSCFSCCPAKYYFSRLLGLSVRGARSIAPDFGTCIHYGLPYCYNMSTVELGINAFEEAWLEYGYGESDPKRNLKRGRDMLLHFAHERACNNCPYEIVKFPQIAPPNGAKRVSETEIPFLLDIGACYPLAGRIDLAIKWSLDHAIWACDYKTSSELSPRLSESFWNSPQACSYTLAMQRLTGKEVPGLMVEAIRVSPVNDEIALYPIHILPHLLENFAGQFFIAADTIREYNNDQEWPQQSSGCASYAMFGFPGSACEYKALCNSRDWTDIASLYEQKEPYHPFEMVG
jgi:hypothetical protein